MSTATFALVCLALAFLIGTWAACALVIGIVRELYESHPLQAGQGHASEEPLRRNQAARGR